LALLAQGLLQALHNQVLLGGGLLKPTGMVILVSRMLFRYAIVAAFRLCFPFLFYIFVLFLEAYFLAFLAAEKVLVVLDVLLQYAILFFEAKLTLSPYCIIIILIFLKNFGFVLPVLYGPLRFHCSIF
jgi:hypothetical protein